MKNTSMFPTGGNTRNFHNNRPMIRRKPLLSSPISRS
jgi:hypothetical protein